MVNTARQGRDVEHAARKALTEAGYWTHRSAGSKGAVDIIAMKPMQVVFVQCKRTGAMAAAEWNTLYDLARWLGAVPVLARRGKPVTTVEFFEMQCRKDPARRGGRSPMIPFILDLAEATS